tara:strand:+ start:7568 stop:9334 length:1767 start_codon:yes stop_codon:yes gene_type:complete
MKSYISLIAKENNNHIILFIILNMVLVVAETFSIALIPLFIDFVISSEPILPNYFDFFKNFLNSENKNDLINFGIIFFTIIFLIKNFFYLSVIFYQASLKKKFNYYLKKRFLRLYIFAPFETMKSYNTSEILRNTDTEVQNYVTNFFNILKFSKDFLLLFSIFLLLLVVDIYSTILALIFLIFCIFLYFLVFYDYLNKLGLRRLKTVNAVYQWINQTCGAIKEIKITKKENKVLENFLNKVDIFEQSKKVTEIISALPVALFEIVFVIIVLLLIKFLAHADSINALPALSLYLVAFIRLLPIVSRFGSNISILRSFNPSVQLLNNEIDKLEKYSKPETEFDKSKKDLIQFEKDFELSDISFKYKDGNQNIFKNFNHKIEKGESVAFLGKSGSGKTTLINIICGLLKPTAGEILVDGKSINENVTGWQQNIGLISQDNYLLDDTLENNIIFLNNKDTIDKKKLDDAIFYSGVYDFLNELNNGLNTKIGEKGSILSSGQIQRVALARLLYRDPEILILDEFTNALDPNNEDFILEKLKKLKDKKNKTYVIISHKLKPLKICDKIIILEKGKISEKFNYLDFYNKYHLLYD